MTMDARNHEQLSARAEFYLCLARAFLAPRDDAMFHALRDALADDLGELAAQVGYDIAAPLAAFRSQMQLVADPLTLLQTYSSIFLAPPTAAHINVGQYLDGAVDGGSVKAMEEAYRLCGVERDAGFRDLSDHVSVQLEFVALLYAALAQKFSGEGTGEALPVDPGQFLQVFAMRWLDGFCADLSQAATTLQLDANPYQPLAQIIHEAAACDAVAVEPDAKAARKQNAIEQARAKYAARGVTAEDIAEIKRKLEARGLSTDHLSVPLELRDGAMGLSKKKTPGVR
jgi:putative dimethyl sulfoxide reductase chaperone